MTIHEHLLQAEVTRRNASPLRLSSIGMWLQACTASCVAHWEAAAIYERLSALSDPELARRGLCRATLGYDLNAGTDGARTLADEVRAACDCLPSGEPQSGLTARTSYPASTGDAACPPQPGSMLAPAASGRGAQPSVTLATNTVS